MDDRNIDAAAPVEQPLVGGDDPGATSGVVGMVATAISR